VIEWCAIELFFLLFPSSRPALSLSLSVQSRETTWYIMSHAGTTVSSTEAIAQFAEMCQRMTGFKALEMMPDCSALVNALTSCSVDDFVKVKRHIVGQKPHAGIRDSPDLYEWYRDMYSKREFASRIEELGDESKRRHYRECHKDIDVIRLDVYPADVLTLDDARRYLLKMGRVLAPFGTHREFVVGCIQSGRLADGIDHAAVSDPEIVFEAIRTAPTPIKELVFRSYGVPMPSIQVARAFITHNPALIKDLMPWEMRMDPEIVATVRASGVADSIKEIPVVMRPDTRWIDHMSEEDEDIPEAARNDSFFTLLRCLYETSDCYGLTEEQRNQPEVMVLCIHLFERKAVKLLGDRLTSNHAYMARLRKLFGDKVMGIVVPAPTA
jgi:hypothetical protein